MNAIGDGTVKVGKLPAGEKSNEVEPVRGLLDDQPSGLTLILDPVFPLVAPEGRPEVMDRDGFDVADPSLVDALPNPENSWVIAKLVTYADHHAFTRRGSDLAR